ncbi:Hypothetical predicted protein [Lecanosticta acicola]|uniref:Uncharacterized protein n=1 Tax=Lecanosticta acicola TaxID=111012 RepID=A0AAI8YRW8_9PEZI|nr:Hypothetical predicted protein [Lecanosticta acicola]
MTASQQHTEAVDQLQTNLNHTLEETGRLFAAMFANPNSPPTSQAARLKALLPVAETAFHGALDKLEWELQRAMKVMRRDLAVCRELSGVQTQQQAQPLAEPQSQPQQATSEISQPSIRNGAPETSKTESGTAQPPAPAPRDTDMTDAAPIQEGKPSAPETSPIAAPASAPAPESKAAPQEKPNTETPPAPESKPAQDEPESAPHGLPLIDTTAAAPNTTDKLKPDDNKPIEDEKAPDTANDLDSLFNDPMSGGGADANADFSFHQDTGNDMDFGSFGADNDNISSLLPGLEDYANNQPSNNTNEVDLDQLFGLGDSNQGAIDSQGAGEQHDTTFDDLMDLAGFDVDGDANNGNNNNTSNTDFADFDSLFN